MSAVGNTVIHFDVNPPRLPPPPPPLCSHPHCPSKALHHRAASGLDEHDHRQAGARSHQAAAALRPRRRRGQTVRAVRPGPGQAERARPVHFPGTATENAKVLASEMERFKQMSVFYVSDADGA